MNASLFLNKTLVIAFKIHTNNSAHIIDFNDGSTSNYLYFTSGHENQYFKVAGKWNTGSETNYISTVVAQLNTQYFATFYFTETNLVFNIYTYAYGVLTNIVSNSIIYSDGGGDINALSSLTTLDFGKSSNISDPYFNGVYEKILFYNGNINSNNPQTNLPLIFTNRINNRFETLSDYTFGNDSGNVFTSIKIQSFNNPTPFVFEILMNGISQYLSFSSFVYGRVVITGNVQMGGTLTANTTNISDPDGPNPIPSFTYQWFYSANYQTGTNAADYITYTELFGQTNSTIYITPMTFPMLPAFDYSAKSLKVRVTYTDALDNTETIWSEATTEITPNSYIQFNNPPTGKPLLSGSLVVGNTLSVNISNVNDPNGGVSDIPWSQSYQWFYALSKKDTYYPIIGATSTMITLTQNIVNRSIKARFRFCDGAGQFEFVDSDPIFPSNRVPLGAPIINGIAKDGETLIADISTINDPDGTSVSPSYTYQWLVSTDFINYSSIIGATSSSFTLNSTYIGKKIKVRVNYSDDNAYNETVTSDASDTVVSISTIPDPPTNLVTTAGNTHLSISFTAGSDGNSPITNYEYAISTDGETYSLFTPFDPIVTTSPVIISGLVNDTLYYIKLKSVNINGSSLESDITTGTPIDTQPNGTVVITGLPYAYEVLSADTSGISDPDVTGPIVFTYQWSYTPQDNIAYSDISGATSSTFQIPIELINGTEPSIKVTVSYTDDYANITSLTSDPIGPIILNPDNLSSYVWTAVGMSATGKYMVAISSKILINVSIGNQIVPQDGMLIVSSDYGETWQQKRSGFLYRHFWNGVSVSADGKYMLATCDNQNNPAEIPILSSDYGNTWNYIDDKTNLSIYNVWRSPSMTADGQIMVLRNGQSTTIVDNLLKISYDFGQSWALLPKPSPDSPPKSIKISSDGRYLLSSTAANNLYISSNYGNSWELIYPGSGPIPIEQNIQTSADFSVITVYTDTTMAVSYNYGKSFTILTLPTSFIDGATTISADGTILASIKGNQLYVSNDSLQLEKPVQSLELGTNNQSIKLYTDNSLSLHGQYTSYINNTETVTTFTFAKTTMDIQDLSGSSVTLSTLNTIYIEKTPSATVNLPAAVDTNGAWISITNATGSNVTIDANGNSILSVDGSVTESTRTIGGGNSMKFVYMDAVWYPFV
jgi:photosystem II stability/assembly factor-like uncharacterized protein